MSQTPQNLSRYLPTDQQARAWGWRLLGAGRQTIGGNAPYPSEGHPINYLFDKDGRRVLDEFQIVFISEGTGSFESASCSHCEVRAGQAVVLFPGEWHSYHPKPELGWTEYWLGFRGREADRIMTAFFSKKTPLLQVGKQAPLIQHFEQIFSWLNQPLPDKEQILASHIPLALALIKSGTSIDESPRGKDSELVLNSKMRMLENLSGKTDLKQLAEDLGVSYSRFRFAFKQETGFGPRSFENLIKLNRSKDLLLRERLTVGETAQALGFSSVYYFSRAFKNQFGRSPHNWVRQQTKRAPEA